MRPIEDFCCQKAKCPDHGVRGKGNLKFEGWSGHKKAIRMIRCRTCRATFLSGRERPWHRRAFPWTRCWPFWNTFGKDVARDPPHAWSGSAATP